MTSMPFAASPFGYGGAPAIPASPTFMGGSQFGGFMPGHTQQPSMSMYGPSSGGMMGQQPSGEHQASDSESGPAPAVSPLHLARPEHARDGSAS